MFTNRRVLGLLAAASLLLAACGGDSQGRTRNQALPETSDSTSESVEPSDSSSDVTISEIEAPQELTINSIVVLENAEVEGQGDDEGSPDTSAPAQNFIAQDEVEDDEITLDDPEEEGAKQIISNKINICHEAGNGKYVEIAVDPNGLNGHGDHAGDVIPAPVGGCSSIEAASTTTTSTTTTTIPKNPNERRWTDDSLGLMRVNEYYSDGVAATGPGGVMGYIMSNGSILPPGLGLDFKSGRVSGTPTRAGNYSFSMYVSFWGCICGLGKSFSVTVEEPLEPEVEDPSWTDTGLGLLIEGINYQDGVAAFPKPKSYSVSGALPPGLAFDGSSGAISGTPNKEGSYPFTVTANYDQGKLAPLSITAVVTPSIAKVWTDDSIAGFMLNAPYSDGVQAKGGGYLDGTMRGVMGYIVGSGSLPAGITLDFKSGRLSGTPTQAGSFRFSIYAGFWSANGLSLQFSGQIGPEQSTTTTAAVVEDEVVEEESTTEDTATDDTTADTVTDDTVTDETVTEDTTTDEGTATSAPNDDTPTEIQGVTPEERTVSLVDIVSPNQIVAQVLPDDVSRIVCDGSCVQLLIKRVGLEKGQVFARISSTEWVPIDTSTESIEFAIDKEITDIQVKVVGEDGATYVMQGQAQREGAGDGSSMSTAIWWLLLVLLLLIAVAIVRERRKQSASN